MYRSSLYKIVVTALFTVVLVTAGVHAQSGGDAYAVAASYYSRGNWQLAKIELRDFVAQFPQHSRATLAQFLLGETLVQLGQFEEARTELGQFLNIAPDHQYAKRALFRRGEAAVRLNKPKLALTDLQKLREQYPEDPLDQFVLPMLGQLYQEMGQTDQSLRHFEEAINRFPNGSSIDRWHFWQARSLEQLGHHEQAATIYRQLASVTDGQQADQSQLQLGLMQYNDQQFDESAATLIAFDTTFAQSPLRTVAQYWRGMGLLAQQHWPQASRVFTGELERASDHELAPALAHYGAVSFSRIGDLAQAATYHDRVFSQWPDSQWASASLHARIMIASREADHSVIDKNAPVFIARFPSSPSLSAVRLIHGRSLLQRREYARASSSLIALVGHNPDAENQLSPERNQEAMFLLGLAYLGEKKFQAVLDLLGPKEPQEQFEISAAGIHLVRGTALVGLKQFDEAVDELQKNLVIIPNGPDSGLCRSRIVTSLIELKQWDNAERGYAQLAESFSEHTMFPVVTLQFAEAMYANGRRTRARELFSVLIDKQYSPAMQARGLSGLAWCQLDHSEPSNAAATFERLLSEHPNSVLASEAAMARAKALEALGRDEAALLLYELVTERYPNSEQVANAMLGAAQIHDRIEQNDQASRILERLTNKYPKSSQISEAYYQWAFILLDMDSKQDAYDKFQQIHDRFPKSRYWPDATYRLASHHYDEGDVSQAQVLAQEILFQEESTHVTPYAIFLSGKIATRGGGRWEIVEQQMKRLLFEYPETPLRLSAQYWIAESFYRRKDYDQAGTAFAELQRTTQGQTDSWLAVIMLRQAQLQAQSHQWNEAQVIAEKIEGQFPKFTNQYEVDYLLGRCQANSAQFTEARAAYQQVLDSSIGGHTETAAMAQWMIGETYYHQENYLSAIRAYGRVETLFDYPQWRAAALLQAGKCHEMLGQWKQASESYAMIGEKYSQTDYSNEAKVRLRVARQRAQLAASDGRIR